MEDEDAELRNPFPSPPSHYIKYTTHNLRLLHLLEERCEDGANSDQHQLLVDQADVPEWSLRVLQKPRIDWILEEPDPYYVVFGETWKVKDEVPSLGELGGTQLYPPGSDDRRPALISILRSMLATYSALTASLLAPPRTASHTEEPEWKRHVEWITTLAQNIVAAANDLRPVQARSNLERMMTRQLDLRREEALNIHSKCDEVDRQVSSLREKSQYILDRKPAETAPKTQPDGYTIPPQAVPVEDPPAALDHSGQVFEWAEQV